MIRSLITEDADKICLHFIFPVRKGSEPTGLKYYSLQGQLKQGI